MVCDGASWSTWDERGAGEGLAPRFGDDVRRLCAPGRERIRELAEHIVSAQQKEIEQMKRWREDWYPEG